jgi:CheY-like chemotaxis protein
VADERDMAMGDPTAPRVGALDSTGFPDLTAVNPFPGVVSESTGTSSPNGSSPETPALVDQAESDTFDADEPGRVTRLAYGRHIRVLLIDADADNADAFSQAAEESVLDVRVETLDTVEAALGRLERQSGPRLRRPTPDVVVVSLPTPEAHRLLGAMQDDPRIDDIPIIVLAETSRADAERRSFALGATAHMAAPRRDYERVALVHALPDFIPSARAAHAHLESHLR